MVIRCGDNLPKDYSPLFKSISVIFSKKSRVIHPLAKL